MQKAYIHYYSGTGNTARAAHNVSEELKSLGYQPEIIFASRTAEAPAGRPGLHFFLSPVYAFSLPRTFRKYLQRLPWAKRSQEGTRTAVIIIHGMISTRGGADAGTESRSLPQAVALLRLRGYNVVYSDSVGYPQNLTPVLPPPGATDMKEILISGDRRVREIARAVASGAKYHRRHALWGIVPGFLAGAVFHLFGRWHMGKFYVSDASCTACGLCEKYCPSRTIRMRHGRPRWGWSCDVCLGCFNFCPEKSVQISLTRILVSLVLSIVLIPAAVWAQDLMLNRLVGIDFLWVFRHAVIHPATRWVAGIGLYALSYLFLFWLSDKILYAMEFIPVLRPFVRWTYTKNRKRYVVPEFNPYKDR